MLLDYKIFYRNFGVRQVNQLMSPRFGSLENFQLPRRAVVHLAHGVPGKYGPSEQDVSLQGFSAAIAKDNRIVQKATSRAVWMHHVTALAPGALGAPIKQTTQPLQLVRQYHQKHRRFRQATDFAKAMSDVESLMVFNYDILPHTVRYQRAAFVSYFEWYNIERTLWKEIAALAAISERPQFIVRQMPQVLPARSSLQLLQNMPQDRPVPAIMNVFQTGERLFLAEIWKWIGPKRETSLISLVPRHLLSRINLVFVESGKWVTINLGMLDSWRQPMPDEKAPNEKENTNLIRPDQYQNRLLRFFMSITQLRTVAAPEVTDLANSQVLDHDDAVEVRKELSLVTKVDSAPATVDPLTGAARINTRLTRAQLNDVIDDKPDDTPDMVKIDLEEMEKLREAEIIAELAPQQNEIDKRAAWITTPQPVTVPVPELKRQSHDQALMKIANAYLNNGSLSAAQYRHYEKLAVTYKQLPSPAPGVSLEEFGTIPPDLLKMESSATIPDIATVPDKSMLKSSLLDFDKRYTQEIMQRDVASMVLCFSQAGYAVTGYEVEPIHSLMGSYNMYTVRVMPTDGTASTIRFKLPIVDPDGSYTSNGVKYNLRKQRGD